MFKKTIFISLFSLFFIFGCNEGNVSKDIKLSRSYAVVYGKVNFIPSSAWKQYIVIKNSAGKDFSVLLDKSRNGINNFVFTVPPGEYKIMELLEKRYSSGGKGIGRKKIEKSVKFTPASGFKVVGGNLFYIGEWKIEKEGIIIKDNKQESDMFLSQTYTNLNAKDALTSIPK